MFGTPWLGTQNPGWKFFFLGHAARTNLVAGFRQCPLIATQRCHWIDAGGAPGRDCAGNSCYQAEQQAARQQHDRVVCVAVRPLRNNFVQAQGKREAA